jgi:predicted esterase
MTRRIAGVLALLFSGSIATRAEDANTYSGEWKTTLGPVKIEQKGNDVTGSIVFFKLPLKGKLKGKDLALGYDEGNIHVDASWSLESGGNSFQGSFQASNGNRGVWNGWRPDPAAASGKPADFSGLWLTDLGLMELTRDGSKVKGRYAFRGTSSLEGDVKGRHLAFNVKAFRTGPGWFDLDEQGEQLTGAGGTDGMPGWYGWKGRRAPEFVRHVPLAAGKIVDGSTDGLLTYCVRAPEGYKATDRKKWPVVLVLHGSNMSGKAYVNTLAASWPDIARDYILLGINGETPSNFSSDQLAFNYTYVNYVGRSTFKGFPGTDPESPALVGEALKELRDVYPVKQYFVGGHSQGGFLTYSLLMNSPEAIAGAFPVSAGVIFQCEPSAYDDAKLQAAQRSVPLAIVHGKNDPLVAFDSGSYAAGLFLDAGWPAIRLFADDNAAHMFGRLPVGPAIRWLEALTSDDPKVVLDFAERRVKESGIRDAIAATRRARNLKLDAPTQARLDRVTKAINEKAIPNSKTYLAAIRDNKDNSWVDGFLAFRDEYEFAEPAADAMAAFSKLRAQHDEPARKAIGEARGLFQQGRRDDGYAKAKEVVDKYCASSSYRLAKQWLAEKK